MQSEGNFLFRSGSRMYPKHQSQKNKQAGWRRIAESHKKLIKLTNKNKHTLTLHIQA